MNDKSAPDALAVKAQTALDRLSSNSDAQDLVDAKQLVEDLRNARQLELMGTLAEAISRHDPQDPKNRRLYAQYLIDTGKVTVAIDVLRALTARLPADDPEAKEANGLLGRAYKQVFFDAADKTTPVAQEALKSAIDAYRKPYDNDPDNTWHGVNLLALVTRARGIGLAFAQDLQAKSLARSVVDRLKAVPEHQRDEWYLPSLAEASLGLGDWQEVEANVRAYVAAPNAKDFQIASTLRQFTQIWDIEKDARGRGLVNILRARLAQIAGQGLQLAAPELQKVREAPDPETGQLEAVLGEKGPETYRWWKTGLDRALAVAAIRRKNDNRVGTGFLVRAQSLGLEPGDELVVVTNFHVVNELGANEAVRPEEAEIVFEAVDANKAYGVEKILWSTGTDQHDISVLRTTTPVVGVEPLPVARSLPVVEPSARVFIIGHPGGRDLAFSFQDNELLGHEGPPQGKPQIPGVCRVHYRAPTEGGSSGSPVFNAKLWEVIALHHKGGKLGMPKLNGETGTYAANEGVSMQSIAEAIKQSVSR